MNRTIRKKFNRSELLSLLQRMATEFEERTSRSGRLRPDADPHTYAYLCVAKQLRELVSIAEGERAATYWTRKEKSATRHTEPRSWMRRFLFGREADGIVY